MTSKEKSKKTSSTSANQSEAGALANQLREIVREEVNSQYSRKHTLDTYFSRLADADKQVTQFIQHVIDETTRASRATIFFYMVSYSISALLLLGGIILALMNTLRDDLVVFDFRAVAIACILIGVAGMVSLQNRNPVKNLRHIVDNLVKLNVIFAGYIRQIHQVDAIFEELVSSGKNISPQVAEQSLNNLQDAMTEAMSAISIISNEMDL